jgi:hypothetical protein
VLHLCGVQQHRLRRGLRAVRHEGKVGTFHIIQSKTRVNMWVGTFHIIQDNKSKTRVNMWVALFTLFCTQNTKYW